MANANIASIGRFSSELLTYLGTQRTVKTVNGQSSNTYKFSTGPTVFPPPGSVSQSTLGEGVVGNYSSDTFNSVRAYFLGRGSGVMYAETMTALAISPPNMAILALRVSILLMLRKYSLPLWLPVASKVQAMPYLNGK